MTIIGKGGEGGGGGEANSPEFCGYARTYAGWYRSSSSTKQKTATGETESRCPTLFSFSLCFALLFPAKRGSTRNSLVWNLAASKQQQEKWSATFVAELQGSSRMWRFCVHAKTEKRSSLRAFGNGAMHTRSRYICKGKRNHDLHPRYGQVLRSLGTRLD
jgi:hypothetical protein